MAQVHKHAAAKHDLIEHFVYLAEKAGLDTAERFLTQVAQTRSANSPARAPSASLTHNN